MKLAEKLLRIKNEAVISSGDKVYLDTAGAGFSVSKRTTDDYNKAADKDEYYAGVEVSWAGPSYRVILVDKNKPFEKEKEASAASEDKVDDVLKAVKAAADKFDKEMEAVAKKMGFTVKKV